MGLRGQARVRGGALPGSGGADAASDQAAWLESFHRGDRATLERCYRDHFAGVERAVGEVLGGADRETVIHEVFSRLLGREDLRRAFHGGTLGAWLATVARNQAIDYRRRMARETPLTAENAEAMGDAAVFEDAAQARLLVERFRRESVPPNWDGVFELRFLQQLSQREAARALGMSRTTLAYRELCIRHRLRRFLLEGDEP